MSNLPNVGTALYGQLSNTLDSTMTPSEETRLMACIAVCLFVVVNMAYLRTEP